MRGSYTLLLALFALNLASISGCAPPPAGPPPAVSAPGGDATLSLEKRNAIDDRVRDGMMRAGVVGLGMAIVIDDRLVYARGFGSADLASKTPVTNDTRFRLASISKLFTAVAALHEVEVGHLDLDAPVQNYVPAFPKKEFPVTSRELLTHTSGIRHYRGDEIHSTTHYTDLIAPLAIFGYSPLAFEPGTKQLYSSYGFNLLGAVVEAAAHRPFADEVADVVLKPAAMSATGIDDETLKPVRATGYDVVDGKISDAAPFDPSNKIPSGGYLASAIDLAKFAIALDRDRLLRAETKHAMWTRQTLKNGDAIPTGLGFGVGRWEGSDTIFHDGGQPGTSTALFMIPAKKCAIVLLTNTSDVKLDSLTHDLATLALGL